MKCFLKRKERRDCFLQHGKKLEFLFPHQKPGNLIECDYENNLEEIQGTFRF